MKQPTRAILLTDEKWDRLITLLHTYCKNDPDAAEIANNIHAQQTYNPSDEPIWTFASGYTRLPERRKLKSVEEEKHIQELLGKTK